MGDGFVDSWGYGYFSVGVDGLVLIGCEVVTVV